MSVVLLNNGCKACHGKGWLFPYIRYTETLAEPENPFLMRRNYQYPVRCRCHPEYLTGDPLSITIDIGNTQIEFCPPVDIETLRVLYKEGAIKRVVWNGDEWSECIDYAIKARASAMFDRNVGHDVADSIFDVATQQKIAELCFYRIVEGWGLPCTPPVLSLQKNRSPFEPEFVIDGMRGRALIHIRTISAHECYGWGASWTFKSIPPKSRFGGTDYYVLCVISTNGALFKGDQKRSVYILSPINASDLPFKPSIRTSGMVCVYLKDLCENGLVSTNTWQRMRKINERQ